MFFFFVVLAIVLMLRKNCKSIFIFKTIFLGSICFVLVMSPWWIRNYQVFGEFVATSVGESGKVFFSGNNPNNMSGGGIGGIDISYEDLNRFEKIKDLTERDKVMFQEGIDWIKNNPSDWIILEFKKLKRLYSPVFYAEKYNLIVCNYANADMVGHTGHLKATMKGIAAVDAGLGEIAQHVLARDGILLITADHGNVEQMLSEDGSQPLTSHTIGPVPLVLFSADDGLGLKEGALCDLAPTLLDMMGMDKPAEMTGVSLLTRA